MGNVTFGVPEDLALALKQALNANVFIETGTYKGNTAQWASRNFLKVHTIEFDEDRYHKTLARISNTIDGSNINMWLGNSKYVLPKILKDINEPVIFWLDAHGTFVLDKPQTEDDEIPIMDELDVIIKWQKTKQKECVILIDDARLFLNPPPIEKGYHPEFWPNYDNVIDFVDIHLGNEYWVGNWKDVIVIYHEKLQNIIENWNNK
jgi:hypothetical protein